MNTPSSRICQFLNVNIDPLSGYFDSNSANQFASPDEGPSHSSSTAAVVSAAYSGKIIFY